MLGGRQSAAWSPKKASVQHPHPPPPPPPPTPMGGREELAQQQSAEKREKHAPARKNSGGTTPSAITIKGDAAPADHVQVRMMRHREPQVVEHRGNANLAPSRLERGDRQGGFGRRREQRQ